MKFQKYTEVRYDPADGHPFRVRRWKASLTRPVAVDYYIDRVPGGFRVKVVPFVGEAEVLGVLPLFHTAVERAEGHAAVDAKSTAETERGA